MAHRYGQRPSELLNGSLEDFAFDLLCCSEAVAEESKQHKKQIEKNKSALKGRK